MLSATLEQSGQTASTRLANLSAEGALVIGPALSDGTSVLLQRNGTDVRGSVTWARGNQSGLKFEEEVDVGSALRTIPAPSRRAAMRTRRPGLKCIPLSETERATLDRWINTGARALGD
jgi:hypothetical protein